MSKSILFCGDYFVWHQSLIFYISVIHEYFPNNGGTWDDGAEFPER